MINLSEVVDLVVAHKVRIDQLEREVKSLQGQLNERNFEARNAREQLVKAREDLSDALADAKRLADELAAARDQPASHVGAAS